MTCNSYVIWTHKNNILTWLNAVRKINRLFLDARDAEDTGIVLESSTISDI